MTDSNKFHPTLAIANIKNHISITMEIENVQYATWVKLFKVHAHSYKVLHHIVPSKKDKEKVPKTNEEKELWSTLDVAILQWIYAKISHDLLHTILELDATTMEAWNRLSDIFKDNKNSWAVTLEQEFYRTNIKDFLNASAYCQRLKQLSDQLKSVDESMSNNCCVLQMVVGLTEAYNGVAILIRQRDPFPLFYQACSMLTLEEVGLAKKVATSRGVTMVVKRVNHSLSKNSHQ
ncbi:uncharacterized protein [Glycine max]|uniref:uncharacterized protein n=1 Tax=Glycine max TaxID=3847 RepID=UPI0003DEB5C6|nr:uncharacterized protein LOC100780242 [Glycine max]|eukprot:XP_025982633.1 uncharacterized protein LOC100780242 [Glycine max]